MVACFAPLCKCRSGRSSCSFYRFPANTARRTRWAFLIRRADRKPDTTSRLCSCHFPRGKDKDPVLFPHLAKSPRVRANSKVQHPPREEDEGQSPACAQEERGGRSPEAEREICPGVSTQTDGVPMFERAERVVLEIELYNTKEELRALREKQAYCRNVYSASQLSEEALKMETGITDRDTFDALVGHLSRAKASISYSSGWIVKSLTLEDQVLLTLMKLKHKYVDLHLASLFHCSTSTVTNVTATLLAVLQGLPFKDIVATLNHTFMPTLFTRLPKLKLKPQVRGTTCTKKSSPQPEVGSSQPSVDLPPPRSERPAAGNGSPDPKRLGPTSGVLDCDEPGDQTLTKDP